MALRLLVIGFLVGAALVPRVVAGQDALGEHEDNDPVARAYEMNNRERCDDWCIGLERVHFLNGVPPTSIAEYGACYGGAAEAHMFGGCAEPVPNREISPDIPADKVVILCVIKITSPAPIGHLVDQDDFYIVDHRYRSYIPDPAYGNPMTAVHDDVLLSSPELIEAALYFTVDEDWEWPFLLAWLPGEPDQVSGGGLIIEDMTPYFEILDSEIVDIVERSG